MHCKSGGLTTKNPELDNPLPLFVPTYKQGKKERAENMRIVYKFRSSRLEVLHKTICSENFRKFSPVVGSCYNKAPRPVTVLHRGCFPGNFRKSVEQSFLCEAASVISLYLHRYLHIFPIHFHLNYSKSYGCSQLYIIIGELLLY